jgi:hypothetical protein
VEQQQQGIEKSGGHAFPAVWRKAGSCQSVFNSEDLKAMTAAAKNRTLSEWTRSTLASPFGIARRPTRRQITEPIRIDRLSSGISRLPFGKWW